MNQVFLVLVHKNPEQLKLLLNQLQSDKSQFFIHVDLKSRIEDFIEKTKSIKNVSFINERYDVQWGSLSIVSATLALIQELKGKANLEYSHAHLISGEDILIKPIKELVLFFTENQATNFINFAPFPIKGWWNGGWYRITNYHFGKSKRSKTFIGKSVRRLYNYLYLFFPFFQKQLIKDLKFYGGSAWWSLTKESIDYTCKYILDNPTYVDYFRYSLLPDEMFFQTILLNSPFSNSVSSNSKRYIKWERKDKSSPSLITINDINGLKNSDAFFARKVDFNISNELYKMI